MRLDELKPNDGAKKRRKRKGRGTAAGQGKTAGRGMKGQKSRTGSGGKLYRQGGNLPFFRRLPFMRGEGFTPINRVDYAEVNLHLLSRYPADSEVNPDVLAEAQIIHNTRKPVVIMGHGKIEVPLKIRAHRVTKGARQKIEAAGGTIEIISDEVE